MNNSFHIHFIGGIFSAPNTSLILYLIVIDITQTPIFNDGLYFFMKFCFEETSKNVIEK